MNRTILSAKDFAIGVLSVTAVILFTSLVILHSLPPQKAMASGQGGVTGDYVVSTSRLDNMTETLFIVDTPSQLMNMYGYIPSRGTVELLQQFDLRALETPPANPAGAQDEGKGRPNRRTR